MLPLLLCRRAASESGSGPPNALPCPALPAQGGGGQRRRIHSKPWRAKGAGEIAGTACQPFASIGCRHETRFRVPFPPRLSPLSLVSLSTRAGHAMRCCVAVQYSTAHETACVPDRSSALLNIQEAAPCPPCLTRVNRLDYQRDLLCAAAAAADECFSSLLFSFLSLSLRHPAPSEKSTTARRM